MKTSAIIRIIVFSLTIVFLSGLLIAGICYDRLSMHFTKESGGSTVGPVAIVEKESRSTGAVNVSGISELEIDWVAGHIKILPGEETDIIRFWDDYTGKEEYLLYYEIDEDTVSIQYARNLDWDSPLGITANHVIEKNLTVQVPANWVCQSLEIDAASAALEIHDLAIESVDIDTASGKCGFENCSFDTLDIDTASGDVVYSGSLRILNCDAASASIAAQLTNIPSRINVDSMSSNVDIALPENAGFTANVDGLSTDLESDFAVENRNGNYVCGDGACLINVNSLSGKLHIRKNTNPSSSNVTEP